MKTILGILALAVACSCAHAQIAVYKIKLTGTVIGADATRKMSRSGYCILGVTTSRITFIPVETVSPKRFVVDEWHGHSIDYCTAGRGKEYITFSKAITEADSSGNASPDSAFLKGITKPTDLWPNGTYRIAASMQGVGRSLYHFGSAPAFEEATATLTLDKKLTSDANTFKYSFDKVVELLRQDLLENGYSERFK